VRRNKRNRLSRAIKTAGLVSKVRDVVGISKNERLSFVKAQISEKGRYVVVENKSNGNLYRVTIDQLQAMFTY